MLFCRSVRDCGRAVRSQWPSFRRFDTRGLGLRRILRCLLDMGIAHEIHSRRHVGCGNTFRRLVIKRDAIAARQLHALREYLGVREKLRLSDVAHMFRQMKDQL